MSNKLEQLEFKFEKLLGFRNMQEKLENWVTLSSVDSILYIVIFNITLADISSNDYKIESTEDWVTRF